MAGLLMLLVQKISKKCEAFAAGVVGCGTFYLSIPFHLYK